MTKEEVYDESISPLMKQILAVCKEHGIAMVCDFELDDLGGDDGPLFCTSVLVPKDASEKMKDLGRRAQGRHTGDVMAYITTTKEG